MGGVAGAPRRLARADARRAASVTGTGGGGAGGWPGPPPVVLPVAADGVFRVDGLPRRTPLLLVARSPGLPAARFASLRVPDAGALDLGDLPLGPAEAVTIRVRDDRDDPCPSATVTLHRVVEDRGLLPDTWGWRAAAFSAPPPAEPEFRGAPDAKGALAFPAVPPGEWLVLAAAPGFTTARERILVAEGYRREPVDLRMRRGLVLEGRVLQADGTPAAGIRVRGCTTDWGEEARRTTTAVDAVSGGNGEFRLEGVPRYGLQMRAETSPGAWCALGTVILPVTGPVELRLPPRTALEGRVLDGATGEPLPGARVVASREEYDDPPSRDSFETTALADAAGAFRLEGVPARGTFLLRVSREGFLTRSAMVSEGAWRSRPAREVRLARGSVLRGRISRRDGSPVAGALVWACPVRERGGPWRDQVMGEESRRVRSGPDGGYRLGGIPPGTTLLVAVADGLLLPDLPHHATWGYRAGPFPDGLLFPVPDSGEAVRDLLLVEGARLRGTGVDGAGAPLAGLRDQADVPDGEGRSGPTGADGSFLVEGLLPGTDRFVHASGPGHLEGWSRSLDIGERETLSDLRIIVRDDTGSVAGTVRREDGTPAAGARVGLAQYGDWFAPGMESGAAWVADGSGSFRAEGVRPGEYNVYAWAEGSSGIFGPRVTVAAGEVVDGIDLVLPRGQAIAGRVLDGEGKPVPAASVCVEEVSEDEEEGQDGPPKQYRSYSQFGGDGPPIPVTYRATATADAEGRFRQDDLVPREYWVSAGAPGHTEAWTRVGPGDADVVLHLCSTLAIAGRLLDAETGAPVAGVPVEVEAEEVTYNTAEVDCPDRGADGSFLATDVPPGSYRVRFAAHWNRPELEYMETEVAAVAAGTKDLVVRLPRGLTLAGRVVDREGSPVADLSLLLHGEGESDRERFGGKASTVTGREGEFRFGGLTPGRHMILVGTEAGSFADAPGNRFVIGTIVGDLEPGTGEVLLRVERGLPIRGRVLEPSGRAALPSPSGGNGRVVVAPSGEEPRSGIDPVFFADSDGAVFETAALPLGRTFDLKASGFADSLGGVLRGVAPGATVEIRLEAGLVLSGRVVDEAGAPVGEGVRVEVRWDGEGDEPDFGDLHYLRTRADGSFRATGLAEGEFRIEAGGDGSDFLPATTKGTFPAGATDVVVTLRRGVSIGGKLLDARGKPVRYPRIRTKGGSDDADGGEDGTFLLRGLEPGPHRLVWNADGWGPDVDLGMHEAPSSGLILTLPANPPPAREEEEEEEEGEEEEK